MSLTAKHWKGAVSRLSIILLILPVTTRRYLQWNLTLARKLNVLSLSENK